MKRTQHAREFENQALIKVRERAGKSVRTIAQELHMAEGTLRKWISKSNQKPACPRLLPNPPNLSQYTKQVIDFIELFSRLA